eukprot:TRINITY_DN112257_c0_g1_i1.p1 TRINITY_DN112257_c0_g1~~TRINITY_DN112257_c0_g1_i1.p1  ORF type:complete len:329 (-),score=45.69 TRINITY_DN112257_c0_g1_i1:126-1085(-)
MNIVLIEPLGVSEAVLTSFSGALKEKGHQFKASPARITETDKLVEFAKDANILMLANQPLPGTVIKSCPNLQMLSVAFTGVDHVDLEACKEKGVVVCNAAGYSTASVAELAIGLIISVLRKIPTGDTATRASGTKSGLGTELAGKTVGVIGAGAIGGSVARICQAFGCKVLIWSRSEKKDLVAAGCTWKANVEEVLQESDVVSLHIPGGAATKGFINAARLKLMKKNAILINTARGSVVDTADLAAALNEGTIAGAGLDVFDVEPPLPADCPLLKTPNTVVTPHVAFATTEALERRAEIVFANITQFLADTPQNVVLGK